MDNEIMDVNLLDSLLDGKTIETSNDPAPGGDPENLEGNDPGTEVPEGDPTPEGDPEPAPAPSADPNAQEEINRTNAAFAKMRVENTQMAKTIKQIAQALGINHADMGAVLAELQGAAVNKLAQANQISPEVYQELEENRERLQQLQLQQNLQLAKEKFIGLQEEFGLTQDELMNFLNLLDTNGINVIQDPSIDVGLLYVRYNHTAMIEKAAQKAREEALKQDNKANQSSTTPSKQSGKPPEDDSDRIESIDGLNALLGDRK